MDIFGPFDSASAAATDLDVSDFASSVLDLGSLRIPLPHNSEVQVEMGEQGPKLLHIVTPYGRITPVGFAAAKSGNLWREVYPSIVDGMTNDGLEAHVEDGPWGAEVVGRTQRATLRLIGVQGGRWMIRFTCAAPNETADEMADIARETIARTVVDRGEAPIPPGQPLPISVPDALAKQIQAAMLARAQRAHTIARQPQDTSARAAAAQTENANQAPSQRDDKEESESEEGAGSSRHSLAGNDTDSGAHAYAAPGATGFDQSAHDSRTEELDTEGKSAEDVAEMGNTGEFVESTRGTNTSSNAKEARERMFEWRSDSVNGSAIQQIAPQNRSF
ncbi:MAG: DUF3710 domain-containing protein [Corynebacterium glucuronolyticum]|nr:DUF3710 domain-containing protein [Corynebacterium glucuronolyticum]